MGSIKQQLVSGVFYTALAKYSGIIISLVVTGILSRLLSPDDFGVAAIATVIIAFFSIFTDVGLSPAIIQHKDLTEKDLSGIFAFTLWTGATIAILFVAASWPIASYYGSPMLRPLCQLLALNLFFASANIVPNALFYKNKEFRFIAIRSLIIQVGGGAAAVVAALSGAGLYALIINPIFSSILIFVISYQRYPQRLRLTSGVSAIRGIFGYSAYQFLFNVINYFSRNLDKLLIGKYMGMSPLGYYEKSYRLMMLPLQNITQVITPVMHPIFSDYQNEPERLASAYERVVRFLAFIGFPLSVFLFFTAKEVTLIIFGNQWMASVPVFQILALSVGIQIILSSSGSMFQAAGDTKSLFICGLFSAVVSVTGMITGIFRFGTLEAVAAGICIAFTLGFIQSYWMMYRVTLKRNPMFFIKQLISPLLASGVLLIVLYPISELTTNGNLILSLLLKGVLFLTIVGGYIQVTGEYDLIGKIRKKIKRDK